MRDNNIDLLRCLGLSLIILAHVAPPAIILNIRTFDVPLMIFISGLTCYEKQISYSWIYIYHRFSRLVFPVWIFLTIYFIPILLLQQIGINLGLNFKHIYGSYLLLDGIGFVWIIRVFLLIALITPLLSKLNNFIKSQYKFIAIFCICLSMYLVATFLNIGTNIKLVNNWIYYAIGYGFLWWLGVRIKNFTKIEIAVLILTLTSIFIVQSIIDLQQIQNLSPLILHINDFKYPPTNIFILYGLIISTLVYTIVYIKKREHLNSFVHFVGCNSIWIYLWHIPAVAVTAKIGIVWYIRYIIVYLIAVFIYNIQLYIIKIIKSRKDFGFLKYLQG